MKASMMSREMAGNGGPVLASPMRNAAPGGRGGGMSYGGRGGGPGRDRLVGNTVTVAKGPFKYATVLQIQASRLLIEHVIR